jgi:hypothetical protein
VVLQSEDHNKRITFHNNFVEPHVEHQTGCQMAAKAPKFGSQWILNFREHGLCLKNKK